VSDVNQLHLPASFVALFVRRGQIKPELPREEIAARFELCEDLATALTDQAAAILWDLGITEADVLERIHRGLLAGAAGLSAGEAGWVCCRLAELLGWAIPEFVQLPLQGPAPG